MMLFTGIFILAHPFLFGKVVKLYLYLNDRFDLGSYSIMFIRTIVTWIYFLIPVSLMGGVLPVLSKLVVRNMAGMGRRFSVLYGFYTLGLLTGLAMASFLLIRLVGTQNTLLVAASLSFLLAISSFLFFNWEGRKDNIPGKLHLRRSHYSDEFVTIAAGKWKRRLLRIFVVGSFAAMTYEILWIRMLVESSSDKTVYFYTVLSLIFLGCLALGSFLAGMAVDKIRKKFFVFAVIQILIGLTSLLSLGLFAQILHLLSQPPAQQISWRVFMTGQAGTVIVLFLLPFTLTGFVFPLVTRMYAEDLKTLGYKIGRLGVLNVVGAVVASFVIPFIFIPLLGTYHVFVASAMVNVGIGIFILLRYRRIGNSLRVILTLSAIMLFTGIIVFSGKKKMVEARRILTGNETVETRHEGRTANVDVQRTPGGDITLYINGAQAVSSDPSALKGDKMLSCLPYLFRPEAEKVLIIGLGIGITSKSMADVGVPEIDIVEISPEVTNVAADAYAYVNDNILAHENISITIEDGRSYLFRSKKQYDIIICNAAHPRLGNALYTEEYYRLCHRSMHPGSYLCQWLPTGWMTEDEFRSLIRSCTGVFSQVTLWWLAPEQALLMASRENRRLDYCRSGELFDRLNRQGSMNASGIDDAGVILAGFLADDAALRNYAQGAIANTDGFPLVEYSRYVATGTDTAILNRLASFRPRFENVISFENCPESASEVLESLVAKNAALKKELK